MMDVNEMADSRAEDETVRWLYRRIAFGLVVAAMVAGFLLGLAAAHAEDAAPAKVPDYVPIVIDKLQYEAVMEHLNGLPFKTALPLVKWLGELEDRAKRQWEADNAPKEVPKP
jgi:Zn-dependent protease